MLSPEWKSRDNHDNIEVSTFSKIVDASTAKLIE